MTQTSERKQDIPAPIAIALLIVVVGFLFAGKVDLKAILQAWNDLLDLNEPLVWVFASAFVVNIGSLVIWAMHLVAKRSTTKHLDKMAGVGSDKLSWRINFWHIAIGGFLAGVVAVLTPSPKASHSIMKALGEVTLNRIDLCVRMNIALACSVAVVIFSSLKRVLKLSRRTKKGMQEFPSEPNALTLGDRDDGGDDARTEWVSIGTRGLNGNIFITGSIGSGKTQGAILPYLDQLLTRLDPKPSVLAIDPKGSFVKEAASIIEKVGLLNKCLRIGELSRVTFNPIYAPNALLGGRYLQIAQMIRAAAANFAKGASQDSFWETAAFNLTKNALIFCASVHDYYTLKDLYGVVTNAHDKKTVQTLLDTLNTKSFSAEARFNIEAAISYFNQEFSQLDSKLRTSILASTTNFLNLFQDYQASQMFCPPRDKLTLKSMDEVVDNGQILLFEVKNSGLARAMGTFVKLHYQQSLLDRISSDDRVKLVPGVLIIDEYQDVATVGDGTVLGDDRFFAKSREANTIAIVATQSLTSLESAIGREKPAKELVQNFRTRIACHSMDINTIKTFQELAGQVDRIRISHGFSESNPDARNNALTGQVESQRVNVGKSINKSSHKEYIVDARDFSELKTFEAIATVFDGVSSHLVKLFLKPHFLENKATSHANVLKGLKGAAATAGVLMSLTAIAAPGWPGICDVVKTPDFNACLDLQIDTCTCGYPPHPCAMISYYGPETFVETAPNPGESSFTTLPGAAGQLKSLVSKTPFGDRGELDSHSFHSHVLTIPLESLFDGPMPCSSHVTEKGCFEAMSEHLGEAWSTGTPDLMQPKFLAWQHAPKACLIAGAASSLVGGEAVFAPAAAPSCSTNQVLPTRYPPSSHSVCNGWGIFFPRSGTYDGTSQVGASLMIASRMKSLASEVFLATPTLPSEKWQMIEPQSSSCFREGQNLGILETAMRTTEQSRLLKPGNERFLYAIWRRTSCCQEYTSVATTQAALLALKASCQIKVK